MGQQNEAAVAAVNQAEAAGNVARAAMIFDAIDAQTAHLTDMDRYDFAFYTWSDMVNIDVPISDDDITAMILRAARHLPEHTVIDLLEVQFGAVEKRIRLDAGRGLTWLPGDHIAILSKPVPGGIVDAVLGRAQLRA